MIRGLCDALLAAIVAPVCAACDAPLETPLDGAVCDSCWRRIPPPSPCVCRICGDALHTWRRDDPPTACARCTRRPRQITRGRSIAPYEGSLRAILHALKYSGRRSVAPRLADLMVQAGAEVLEGADFVVPVPLHPRRQWSRGFNQASDLAEHLGINVVHALRRRRATVTQTDLSEAARIANVRDAFSVKRRARVAGAIVVVVDDVSTTGATVDACARALLVAGAREVRALTAARAAARLP